MTPEELRLAIQEAGVTAIEAKIYLVLLQRGPQQAGSITKLSGIHRRTVYDAIARLIEKGLIAYIKQNTTRVYEATEPQRLLDLAKEREMRVLSAIPTLNAMIPDKTRHETTVIRGKRALRGLLRTVPKNAFIVGADPFSAVQLRNSRLVKIVKRGREQVATIVSSDMTVILILEQMVGVIIYEESVARQFSALLK